jgi:hypothetical protein
VNRRRGREKGRGRGGGLEREREVALGMMASKETKRNEKRECWMTSPRKSFPNLSSLVYVDIIIIIIYLNIHLFRIYIFFSKEW